MMKINVLANRMTWSAADNTDTPIRRVLLEADNGATGRLIWDYPNDKPRFLGENMNESQLKAGKKAALLVESAKLNKSAIQDDIYTLLLEGGWNSILPSA